MGGRPILGFVDFIGGKIALFVTQKQIFLDHRLSTSDVISRGSRFGGNQHRANEIGDLMLVPASESDLRHTDEIRAPTFAGSTADSRVSEKVIDGETE